MYFDWKYGIKDEELKKVTDILKNDGIVIFPTETVYGIAASAFSSKAIDKLYKLKKRPKGKAINIMIYDKNKIEKYAYIKSDLERRIIDKFMPGSITIIFDKKEEIGEEYTKKDTLGIRIPSNEIALKILKEVEIPLAVSSANISNEKTKTNPKDIYKDFKDIDIFIDGGVINDNPSTIVRVENDKIDIIRKGKITKDYIIKKIYDLYFFFVRHVSVKA